MSYPLRYSKKHKHNNSNMYAFTQTQTQNEIENENENETLEYEYNVYGDDSIAVVEDCCCHRNVFDYNNNNNNNNNNQDLSLGIMPEYFIGSEMNDLFQNCTEIDLIFYLCTSIYCDNTIFDCSVLYLNSNIMSIVFNNNNRKKKNFPFMNFMDPDTDPHPHLLQKHSIQTIVATLKECDQQSKSRIYLPYIVQRVLSMFANRLYVRRRAYQRKQTLTGNYIYIYMYLHLYIYIYIYMDSYINIHIHIHVRIHIHVHISTTYCTKSIIYVC